jgi:hypothetical protein
MQIKYCGKKISKLYYMDICKSCNTKLTESELHLRSFDTSKTFYNFLFQSHCSKCIEQSNVKFTKEDINKFNENLFEEIKDDPDKMKYCELLKYYVNCVSESNF